VKGDPHELIVHRRFAVAGHDTGMWIGYALTAGIGEGAANTMKLTADDVQSVVIPGSGHYCLEEAPEEMLAAVTAFLAPYRDGQCG